MSVLSRLQKYLDEIRDEVCSRCAHQVLETSDPGVDTPCGLRLPVDQLVEALQPSQMEPATPPAHYCPCSREKLAALAAEAAADMERQRQRRERLLETWNDG